jgi:hypothetical protein
MPFGLGAGEVILTLVALLLVYVLPLVAIVWTMRLLLRLRRGQTELLARLSAIERQLGVKS